MNALVFDATAIQITGPREYQNDSYRYGADYAVVADGVGSDISARLAADLASNYYSSLTSSRLTVDHLLEAPAAIGSQLLNNPASGSSTVVAALLDSYSRLWLTAVGDSRYAVIRDGRVLAHNEPHNRASYARALDPGVPTPFGAESVLTRSLGGGRRDVADVRTLATVGGDVVVLMTDGIDAKLTLSRIVEIIGASESPSAGCSSILEAAAAVSPLDDNATCLVAFVTERSAQ